MNAPPENEQPFSLETRENVFARQKFREHYAGEGKTFVPPPSVGAREFGVGWEKKIDFRHKSFSGENELKDFLAREAPFYVSYSVARYSFPSARPMEKKNFLGADLVFDLDKPKQAPEHEHAEILCPTCLEKTREDAVLFLEDFLLDDFGFDEKEVQINFSGSKGYHFHVRSGAVQKLSSNGRKELCDYAAALGVSAEFDKGVFEKNSFGKRKDDFSLEGPASDSRGWKKKVYSFVKNFVGTSGAENPGDGDSGVEKFKELLKGLGLSPQKTKLFLDSRREVLQKISEGKYSLPPNFEEFWQKLGSQAIASARVELDSPVSFDLARLIRVPNTLHGDTGLVAKTISRRELPGFEPLNEAVAFKKDFAEVICSEELKEQKIVFLGQEFGVKPGLKTELPTGLVIILLRKGKAKLAQ